MKKRMLCLLMAMVVLLLPLLLAACNDPNYMGTLPPAASGGQEGGEKLSEEDLHRDMGVFARERRCQHFFRVLFTECIHPDESLSVWWAKA